MPPARGAARKMQGSITHYDVLRHPWIIIRHFGPALYLRALRAALGRKPCTFLGVLYSARNEQVS